MKWNLRILFPLVLLVAGSWGPAAAFSRRSAPPRWEPEILSLDSGVYLPDFSYAGYRWGEEPLPEALGTVLRATDFGARADDGSDDTAALRAALRTAHEVDGPVVLLLPAGRLVVREILWIRRGDFVLQGAGSGDGGTTLFCPLPLDSMEQPEAAVKQREYLVGANKRVKGGRLFSVWSWLGGVIWTEVAPRGPAFRSEIVAGERDGRTITLATPLALAPGTMAQIRWYNREGEDSSFLDHLFGGLDPGRIGKNLHSSPRRALAYQEITVVAAAGSLLTIKEPLAHDLRPEWGCWLTDPPFLSELGIEGLRIEFPALDYEGHFLEPGYNGLYLTGLAHSWVRDVAIGNADSGVLVDKCRNLTLRELTLDGRGGHYSVSLTGSRYVLVEDFRFLAPAYHNPSFSIFSLRNVYTRGEVSGARLDQHCAVNHQNLFDDLRLRIEDTLDLFHHGGAGYWWPTAGAFNTFWNLSVDCERAGVPRISDAPAARFVGLHGTMPLEIDYGPGAYIEGLNRPGIAVPSLYRHQLEARLGGR